MTYIRTIVPRPAEADLSVHVRPVQIYLAAKFVNDVADPSNVLIENTVSRWVCHHQRGQLLTMLPSLCFEIIKIHATVFVTRDDDNFVTRHHRGRRVRT